MSTATETLTLERFREVYCHAKPHFEYWDGEARQKAMPTKLHARLQRLLANMLAELGFYAFTELTLRIDPHWEPVPDGACTLEDFPEPYPVRAVDAVVEILSPADSFAAVEEKCERYAALGVRDILVVDPVGRTAWVWDVGVKSLVPVPHQSIRLNSISGELRLAEIWTRFESER